MSNAYKKVAKPVAEPKPRAEYRPAELVRKYGDNWSYLVPIECAGATALALRDCTQDSYEAHLMRRMEEGLHPRVEE